MVDDYIYCEIEPIEFLPEFRDALLDGRKRGTFRRGRRKGNTLVVFCGNECLGDIITYTQTAIHGRAITDEMARRDGFDNAHLLKNKLMEIYKVTLSKVDNTVWYFIEWGGLDGPNA